MLRVGLDLNMLEFRRDTAVTFTTALFRAGHTAQYAVSNGLDAANKLIKALDKK